MNAATKSALRILLRGIAWLLFAIAVVTFLFGGQTIRAFAKTDWLLAEMEGAGLAMVSAGLGVFAKIGAERFEEDEINGPPPASP
jgi:hypothetical protein